MHHIYLFKGTAFPDKNRAGRETVAFDEGYHYLLLTIDSTFCYECFQRLA
jgi:hypothetical protein